MLVNNKPIAEARQQVGENLYVIGSDINLAAAEVELAGVVGREVILRDALAEDAEPFDFMLMDYAPSLGVLTVNALSAATKFLFRCSRTSWRCTDSANCSKPRRWSPSGSTRCCASRAFCCACTKRARNWRRKWRRICRSISTKAAERKRLWADARLFETRIRRNIKLAESPSFGQSIFGYAPGCNGAADYAALAREVLGGEADAIEADAEPTLFAEPVAS